MKTMVREHEVRVTFIGRNTAFRSGIMLESVAVEFAESERMNPETTEIIIECDPYCWCQ